MIYIWLFIAVLTGVTAYFVWGGRVWLKARFPDFFAKIEPIEIVLWKKSETILFARFKMLVGILLTTLTQAGQIDITPLMPLVPDEYEPYVRLAFNMLPMVITALGAIDEYARRDVSKPLAIVALPDAVVAASPGIQQIVANAEQVKAEAVAMQPEAEAIEAEISKAA